MGFSALDYGVFFGYIIFIVELSLWVSQDLYLIRHGSSSIEHR